MESRTDICLKEICKQLKDLNHTMRKINDILKPNCVDKREEIRNEDVVNSQKEVKN